LFRTCFSIAFANMHSRSGFPSGSPLSPNDDDVQLRDPIMRTA
jgi:hypothetical protein